MILTPSSTSTTVTVTAVDDGDDEGTHTGTIRHSAVGGGYHGVTIANVVANVTDDDGGGGPPSVSVFESGGSTDITEGGGAASTDKYTVELDSQPSATVTITITTDGETTVSPTTLTFTTSDWNSKQTVDATVVDDGAVEGGHVGKITHSASGGGYDSVSIPAVLANITDNDTAGVTILETNVSTDVTEGAATDNYNVVLDRQPSETVTIAVIPDGQVTLSTTTLTFTPGNWSTPQTVLVTAVDDQVDEGGHTGTVRHLASGGNYDGVVIADLVATITDNEQFTLSKSFTGFTAEVTVGTPSSSACPGAGIEVTKAADPVVIFSGEPTVVTYVISITNKDIGDFKNLQRIEDFLPPGLPYIAGSASAAWSSENSTDNTNHPYNVCDFEPTVVTQASGRQKLTWFNKPSANGFYPGVNICNDNVPYIPVGGTLTQTFQALANLTDTGAYYNEVFVYFDEWKSFGGDRGILGNLIPSWPTAGTLVLLAISTSGTD